MTTEGMVEVTTKETNVTELTRKERTIEQITGEITRILTKATKMTRIVTRRTIKEEIKDKGIKTGTIKMIRINITLTKKTIGKILMSKKAIEARKNIKKMTMISMNPKTWITTLTILKRRTTLPILTSKTIMVGTVEVTIITGNLKEITIATTVARSKQIIREKMKSTMITMNIRTMMSMMITLTGEMVENNPSSLSSKASLTKEEMLTVTRKGRTESVMVVETSLHPRSMIQTT